MKKKQIPSENGPVSAGLQRYLYFTAAMTGAAIMIIEILGAKMLAPYLGTSHFVWTAQIAVTLVSLAVGYYMGGYLVDRLPYLGYLYASILAAAVYLCFTLLFVEPVAYLCLRYKLAVGSLLASTFLFFVPLSLLAMVGPFLVRILTLSLDRVGVSIGRLTAISTLGSFAGTVLIGYVLVPFLPNSVTMFSTAGVLAALAAVYFLFWRTQSVSYAGLIIVLLTLSTVGYAGVRRESVSRLRNVKEIYRANSNFGQLQVIEGSNGRRRHYLNDYLTQNTYDPTTGQSLSTFTYMLHDLAVAYTPTLTNALCIGLGVGIVPMRLAEQRVDVDVIEINPGVVPVGEKFFGLRPSQINIMIGDGRYFLNETAKTYNTVILDAFLGDSSPSHLMTREAFEAIRKVLSPGGTLVINCFGHLDEGRNFFLGSLQKTLSAVFQKTVMHTSSLGNVFFVASDNEALAILKQPDFSKVHPACRQETQTAFANIIREPIKNGIILSDDYNPVEFHDAANREEWRRNLAQYMQKL